MKKTSGPSLEGQVVIAPRNDNGKRIYRAITEAARRIDAARQNATSISELFESPIEIQRIKLRDSCEKLLFAEPLLFGRKSQELLWRKSYYDVINSAKKLINKQDYSSADILILHNHIDSGIGYYSSFLFKLQIEFNIDLDNVIDFPTNSQINNQQLSNEVKKWAYLCAHSCLISLGDLCRYKLELDPAWGVRNAVHYYKQAVCLDPRIGMPFNQLGTLSGSANYHLDAVYYYIRCLLTPQPFDGAENNLKIIFEKNRAYLNNIKNDQTIDDYMEHIKICIARFLYLFEIWIFNKNNEENINDMCHAAISDFRECILYMEPLEQHKNDVTDVQAFLRGHNSKSHPEYIDPDMVFKISTVCIMCVQKLQDINSSHVSLVKAFTLAMFLELVDFVIENINDSLYDNENENKEIVNVDTPNENKEIVDIDVQNDDHKDSVILELSNREELASTELIVNVPELENIESEINEKKIQEISKINKSNCRRRRRRHYSVSSLSSLDLSSSSSEYTEGSRNEDFDSEDDLSEDEDTEPDIIIERVEDLSSSFDENDPFESFINRDRGDSLRIDEGIVDKDVKKSLVHENNIINSKDLELTIERNFEDEKLSIVRDMKEDTLVFKFRDMDLIEKIDTDLDNKYIEDEEDFTKRVSKDSGECELLLDRNDGEVVKVGTLENADVEDVVEKEEKIEIVNGKNHSETENEYRNNRYNRRKNYNTVHTSPDLVLSVALPESPLLRSVKVLCDWLRSDTALIERCSRTSPPHFMRRLLQLLDKVNVDVFSRRWQRDMMRGRDGSVIRGVRWCPDAPGAIKEDIGGAVAVARVLDVLREVNMKTALDEDVELRGLNILEQAHEPLDFKRDQHVLDLNPREECLLRIQKLVNFGFFMVKIRSARVEFNSKSRCFVLKRQRDGGVGGTDRTRTRTRRGTRGGDYRSTRRDGRGTRVRRYNRRNNRRMNMDNEHEYRGGRNNNRNNHRRNHHHNTENNINDDEDNNDRQYLNNSYYDSDDSEEIDVDKLDHMGRLWLRSKINDLEEPPDKTDDTKTRTEDSTSTTTVVVSNDKNSSSAIKAKLTVYPSSRRHRISGTGGGGGVVTNSNPYYVVDTTALTENMRAVKQLVESRTAIVLLPSVVLRSLDMLKPTCTLARDAIRWLERQMARGDRFLRAQRQHERLPVPRVQIPKRLDKEAEEYVQIVEFCHFFTSLDEDENDDTPINTISRKKKDTPSLTLLTGSSLSDFSTKDFSVSGLAQSAGVRVERINTFYEKWKKLQQQQHYPRRDNSRRLPRRRRKFS